MTNSAMSTGWVRQIGTANNDAFNSVFADPSSGGAYVAGQTDGTFPGLSSAGVRDAVAITYDLGGNIVWKNQIGTAAADAGYGIAYDGSSSSLFMAGETTGTFAGQSNQGSSDAFLAKFKAVQPSIFSISDTPDPISPNADGIQDSATISFATNEGGNYSIAIKNSGGTTVRTLNGPAASGVSNVLWDGKDGSNAVVSDGSYTYYISFTSTASGQTRAAPPGGDGLITVDTAPPTVAITLPAQDSFVNTRTPTITGTAEASSTVKVYNNDTSPGVLIGTATADGTGAWSVVSSTLIEGAHNISAKATDVVGNTGTASELRHFTVDTIAPTAEPANGLQSLWKGEGDALDSIDSKNGNLENGVGFATGKVGQGLSFDGINDSVNIGDAYDFSGTSPMTVSFWMKPNTATPTEWEGLLSKEDSTVSGAARQGWAITHEKTTGNIVFERWQAGTGDSVASYYPPQPGSFTHVVATYDGTTIKIYINGSLEGSVTSTRSMPDTTSPLRIGSRQMSFYNSYFGGIIDEVRIYNRALTGTEIQALFNPNGNAVLINSGSTYTNSVNVNLSLVCSDTGSSCAQMQIAPDGVVYGSPVAFATSTTVTLPSVDGTKTVKVKFIDAAGNISAEYIDTIILDTSARTALPTNGLVGWWSAEGNANDALGVNNGALQNGLGFSSSGASGQAFSFDGVNDYAKITASSSTNVGTGSGFTIDGWISPTDITSEHPVVEWNNNAGNYATHVWISSPWFLGGGGALYANIRDTSNVDHAFSTGPNVFYPNILQHFALAYDKTTGIASIYRDGILVKQQNIGVFTPLTTYDLYLGARVSGPGAGSVFSGLMDEVHLYNRALSASEIASIAKGGAAVVVNSNAAYTTSTIVTLAMSCSVNGASCPQMQVSADGTLDTEPFEAFAATKTVTLPSGDGTKTVKVVFKDNLGNVTPEVSDAIALDTTAPTAPTLASPTNGQTLINAIPSFTWTASTDSSTITYELLIDNNADFSSPEISQTGLTSTSFTPSSISAGTFNWKVRAKDAAGNLGAYSSVFTFTIRTVILNSANGHYYEAVPAPAGINWFNANSTSTGMTFNGANGHLASVNSQQEQDFIVNTFPQVKAPTTSPFGAGYWLGGFQPSGSAEPAGGWRWTTAEGFLYSSWIPGEPNNFGGAEDGIAYWWYPGATGNGANWSDIPRTSAEPGYVVEYELDNVVFNPSNGHYYEAVPTTMTGINWFNAKVAAEQKTNAGLRGHLASVTSQAEQDFIVNNLPQVKAPVVLDSGGYWLGGFQPSGSAEPAGGWRWTTNEPFSFTYWQPGEPNNLGCCGNEDGVVYWGNPGTNSGDGAKWNDAYRNYAASGYVVEYEADTTGPVTSSAVVTPNPTNSNPTVTATASDAINTIVAAEFFIDSVGANGTGSPMSASDGAFDLSTEGITGIINIGSLSDGTHTVFVHAKDSAGNWSPVASNTFTVDAIGPSVSITSPANNTAINTSISLTGTSADSVSGVQKVVVQADSPFFSSKFGSAGAGNGQFQGVVGIAFDSSGNVYVADFIDRRIEKFTASGSYLSQFGTSGSGNGQFINPNGIAIDSSGNIYVADAGNNRVQKFNSAGVYLSQFGSFGAGNGQFKTPLYIAIDSSDNLFVTDRDNHRVQKFNSAGVYLSQFGTSGTGNGQFNQPIGIAIDSAGNIYVVDSGNSRIQKFNSAGVYLSQFGTSGTGNGQFMSAQDIAIDATGNIYVTDYNNNRVQKFNSAGVYLSQFGSFGAGNGQFRGPLGIGINSSGNIYVADNNNNRVQIFTESVVATGTTSWSATVEGLSDGLHKLTAKATDNAGNSNSTSIFVTVDTALPAAPAITSPASGTATNNVTPTASGTAEANSQVKIYDGDITLGGTQTNTVTAASGTFKTATATGITVTTSGATAGSISIQQTVTLGTSATIVGTPSVSKSGTVGAGLTLGTPTVSITPTTSSTTKTITITLPFSTTAAITGASIGTLNVSFNLGTASTASIATATGSPSARLIGTATADGSGAWSLTLSTLTEGSHSLVATATDASGNVSPKSTAVSITVDTIVPTVLISSPTAGASINSTQPNITGTSADAGGSGIQKVEVSIDSGAFQLATGTTSWSFVPSSALSDGSHTIVAKATDNAGNSATSPIRTITVDTVPPAAPIITSPADGITTLEDKPLISGTAEVGSTVRVFEGATLIGTSATVPASGAWSVAPTSSLSAGSHTLTAKATDSAGNISPASSGITITIQPQKLPDFITGWDYYVSNGGKFNQPAGITFDSAGNIYVVDRNNNRIQKFDSSGNFITSWGNTGACCVTQSFTGQFVAPEDIAIDSDGHLLVVESSNARVQKFSADGAFISTFGSSGSTNGKFNSPNAIARDPSGDYIYVLDGSFSGARVQKLTKDGAFVSSFTGGFVNPSGLTTDIDGNIYVADTGNNKIKKFSSAGTPLLTFGSSGSGNGQLFGPYSVAVDSSGNIFVADRSNNRIQKFDSSGGFVAKWGSSGSGTGQFASPEYVAVDAAGNVYVSDTSNHRIQKFDNNGNFISTFGSFGNGNTQFFTPVSIATDSNGNIFVADRSHNLIHKYSSSRVYIKSWALTVHPPGGFNSPQYVAVDSAGNVYVSDIGSDIIHKFNNDGNLISTFGSLGNGNGQFNDPGGITFDSAGNIYVADTGNQRIQKFDSAGSFVTKWGSQCQVGLQGACLGQFLYPEDVTIDSDGNLLVVESSNARVQKFAPDGTFISTFGSSGTASGQFNTPRGIASDPTGNYIYVMDGSFSGARLQKLTKDGLFVFSLNANFPGGVTTTGSFQQPFGVDTDQSGNIYIVDTGNQRIIEYGELPPAVSITYPAPDALLNATSFTVTGTASDSVGIQKVEVKIDFGSYQLASGTTPTWSFAASSLSDGSHTITARATDNGGNTAQVSITFTVDTIAPSAPSSSSPADGSSINDNTPLFDWSDSADATAITYELLVDNNSDFSSPEILETGITASNFTATSALADGTYYWKVRAVDAAGNNGSYSTVSSFTISTVPADATPPTLSAISDSPDPFSPNGDGNRDTSTITFTSDEAGLYTIMILTPSNGPVQNLTGTLVAGVNNAIWDGLKYDSTLAPDGLYKYNILAQDAAGNVRSAPGGIDGLITLDSMIPASPVITSPANSTITSDNTPTINGTVAANLLTKFGSQGSAGGQFNRPFDIAFDSIGNLYITDQQNHRIQKFDANLNFITTWGSFGTGNGQFDQPTGIAIDPADDSVYVTEEGNHRVQKFSSSGTFITKWGAPGSADGQFLFPVGIAVDSGGDVYVVDSNHRVQKFDSNGAFITKWTTGIAPAFIAIDKNDLVYVTIQSDGSPIPHLQKFDSSGNLLAEWGSTGTGDGQFSNSIQDVAIAPNGDIYISDWGNSRIQKLTNAGTFITKWGSLGSADGQFNIPSGIALDDSGNLYVADVDNHRIQKFEANSDNALVEIFDGAASLGTFTTDPSATWSFTPSTPLSDGLHIITAKVTDAAGNTSPPNGHIEVTITSSGSSGSGGGGGSSASKIAFASDRDGNFEIYVMNTDGTGQTRLTSDPAWDTSPSWSPDGSKIAFSSDRDNLGGPSEIYVMNVDGSGLTRLTNDAFDDAAPVWSPDGSKIAFVRIPAIGADAEIYVMNADGSGQTNISNNPSSWDVFPSWSPDGSKIAFQSDNNGADIFIMNSDGSGRTALTSDPADDWYPSWSPDGTKIAFTSDRDGPDQIYIMNIDGSGQTNISNSPDPEAAPRWSPDGTEMVFERWNSNYQIYIMNSDGSGKTRLTNSAGNDQYPVWSPVLGSSDTTPPTLSAISDSPDPFSPNSDGINDNVTITFTSDEAGSYTIMILTPGNGPVQNLTGSMVAGVNSAVWDGLKYDSSSAPDGIYKYIILASDTTGNSRPLPSQDGFITIDRGTIAFDKSVYDVTDTATITAVRPLSNTGPFTIDSMAVNLTSSTDPVGIFVLLTETGPNTAVFVNNNDIHFTASGSSSSATSTLRVSAGDTIMTASSLVPEATASISGGVGGLFVATDKSDYTKGETVMVNGNTGPAVINIINAVNVTNVGLTDILGNPTSFQPGVQVIVSANLHNLNATASQPFAFVIEVKRSDGTPETIAWQTGVLAPGGDAQVGLSWMPAEDDSYAIRILVLRDITTTMQPLSPGITYDVRNNVATADSAQAEALIKVLNPSGFVYHFELVGVLADGSFADSFILDGPLAEVGTYVLTAWQGSSSNSTTSFDMSLPSAIVSLAIDNTNPPWGVNTFANVTVTGAQAGDYVVVSQGNGQAFTHPAFTGSFDGRIDLTPLAYDSSEVGGTFLVNATLYNSSNTPIATSNVVAVTVDKRPSILTLRLPASVVNGTNFTAYGDLADGLTGLGLEGRTITFNTLPGIPLGAATTHGINVTDAAGIEIVSCSAPGCTPDNPNAGSINLLMLHPGATISMPPGINAAAITLQGIAGGGTATVKVTRSDASTFEATSDPAGLGVATLVLTARDIDHPGENIQSIEVISATGGMFGTSKIELIDAEADPTTVVSASFDYLAVQNYGTSLTLVPGSYYSSAQSPVLVLPEIPVSAHFAGDSLYYGVDSEEQSFATELGFSLFGAGLGGVETTTPKTSTTSFTILSCSAQDPDTDGDGLCDSWETSGIASTFGIPYTADPTSGLTSYYVLPSTKVPGTETLQQTSYKHKDIFVQVDAMDGQGPSDAALKRVVDAFAASPNVNPDGSTGITLHIIKGNYNLPFVGSLDKTVPAGAAPRLFYVWNDPVTDRTDNTNNYFGVKKEHFGTDDVRSNSNKLNAYANAVRYSLFVSTIGTSSISGLAETLGNDMVVSLGSFGGYDNPHGGKTGSETEQAAAFMHELGHLLNLKHGGPSEIMAKISGTQVNTFTPPPAGSRSPYVYTTTLDGYTLDTMGPVSGRIKLQQVVQFASDLSYMLTPSVSAASGADSRLGQPTVTVDAASTPSKKILNIDYPFNVPYMDPTQGIDYAIDFGTPNTSKYLRAADSTVYDVGTQDFWTAFMVKVNDFSNTPNSIAKRNQAASTNPGYSAAFNPSGQIIVRTTNATGATVLSTFTAASMSTGKWYAIAFSWDRDANLKIYLYDIATGTLSTQSFSITTVQGSLSNTQLFTIARHPEGAIGFLSGQMDNLIPPQIGQTLPALTAQNFKDFVTSGTLVGVASKYNFNTWDPKGAVTVADASGANPLTFYSGSQQVAPTFVPDTAVPMTDSTVTKITIPKLTITLPVSPNVNIASFGTPAYPTLSKAVLQDSSLNCKPNYPSVMSYARQMPRYLSESNEYQLDYSRGNYAPLNETMLVETNGLFSRDGLLRPYNVVIYGSPNSQLSTISGTTQVQKGYSSGPGQIPPTPIDWNADNAFGTVSVSANILNVSIDGCNPADLTTTILHDYNDWNNINLNWKQNPAGTFDGIATAPNKVADEITEAIDQQMKDQVSTVEIDTVTNDKIRYGESVSITGSSSNAPENAKLVINWGDGTSEQFENAIDPLTGKWPVGGGALSHTFGFDGIGERRITASLLDGTGSAVATSAGTTVFVQPHRVTIILDPIADSVPSGALTVTGGVYDDDLGGEPVANAEMISFITTGGDLPSVSTDALGRFLSTGTAPDIPGIYDVRAEIINTNYTTANSEPQQFRVVDIPPTVTGELSREPNERGWYNSTVTIHWAGRSDIPSITVVSCDPDTVYSGPDGESITITGHCVDNFGGIGNGTVVINYDSEPPVIDALPDITVEATSARGAILTYTSPTATDNIGVASGPECTPQSGSLIPIGTTTIICTAADAAGNVGNRTQLVKVQDSTSPVISTPGDIRAEATSPAGAQVTFSISASDAVDGPLEPQCDHQSGETFPIGTTQVNCSVSDSSHNTATARFDITVSDETNPTITATISPTPNANGWNNSPVTVSFACEDTGTGIAGSCPQPVTISTEGAGQSITRSVSDNAGHAASVTVTVNIDMTAPEAFFQFDPVRKDILVFGKDNLSGPSSSDPFVPVSSVWAKWEGESDDPDKGKNVELRTYRITDLAGNSLTIGEKVKLDGKEIRAKIVSLQYNNDPAILLLDNNSSAGKNNGTTTPPGLSKNEMKFEYSVDKDGSAIKELNQKIDIGQGKDKQRLDAKYDAKKNETTIKTSEPKPEKQVVKAGLVLIRLSTDRGSFTIGY